MAETATPFRLRGKAVTVTGGAQAIGLAAARLCRDLGATVVLLDRDEAALASATPSTASPASARAVSSAADAARRSTRVLDVTREEDVAAAIVFLASPAAAMSTGHTLPLDGGDLAQ